MVLQGVPCRVVIMGPLAMHLCMCGLPMLYLKWVILYRFGLRPGIVDAGKVKVLGNRYGAHRALVIGSGG